MAGTQRTDPVLYRRLHCIAVYESICLNDDPRVSDAPTGANVRVPLPLDSSWKVNFSRGGPSYSSRVPPTLVASLLL